MNRNALRLWLPVLLGWAFLAPDASAYLGNGWIGSPIDQYGTRYRDGSPSIEIRINTLKGIGSQGSAQFSRYVELTAAERSDLTSMVLEAIDAFNRLPECAIVLEFGGAVRSTSFTARRSYILFSFGELARGSLGVSWSFSRGDQHVPTGSIIRSGVGAATVVHELAHGLGLDHSHLGYGLTYNQRFGWTNSRGAIMSYSLSGSLRPILHSDDIAGLSDLYPSSRFGKATGAIEGEMIASTGRGLFGANVFVVDARRRAVVARVSGMHEHAGVGAHGRFFLPVLEPGTYTLVAAPVSSSTYRTGSSGGGYTHLDGNYPSSFAASVISGIVVRAGQATQLGRIAPGTEGRHGGGSSTTIDPRPSGPVEFGYTVRWNAIRGASGYYLYVWNHAKGEWIAQQWTTATSHRVTTTAAKHTIYVYARVGGSWYRVEAYETHLSP